MTALAERHPLHRVRRGHASGHVAAQRPAERPSDDAVLLATARARLNAPDVAVRTKTPRTDDGDTLRFVHLGNSVVLNCPPEATHLANRNVMFGLTEHEGQIQYVCVDARGSGWKTHAIHRFDTLAAAARWTDTYLDALRADGFTPATTLGGRPAHLWMRWQLTGN